MISYNSGIHVYDNYSLKNAVIDGHFDIHVDNDDPLQ
jgi:hypothetical protein